MFSFIASLFRSKPKKPVTRSRLQIMTKKELEMVGRKHGIELDRRFHKLDLVEQLYKHIQKQKNV